MAYSLLFANQFDSFFEASTIQKHECSENNLSIGLRCFYCCNTPHDYMKLTDSGSWDFGFIDEDTLYCSYSVINFNRPKHREWLNLNLFVTSFDPKQLYYQKK